MKQKTWVAAIIFFTFFSFYFENQAQNIKKEISFDWTSPIQFQKDENTIIELLNFYGAVSGTDFPTLPHYSEKFLVNGDYESYQYTFSNIITAPFTSTEVKLIPALFNQKSVEAEIRTAGLSKKNYALLSFIPIIYQGNTPLKVVSCSIEIIPNKIKLYNKSKEVENSVLAIGNWYKIGITKSGIYKVTYQDFVQLGITSGNIQSSSISLFGNGGKMLPEANGILRPSDLTENRIVIIDGGDGIFNNDDYFLFYGIGIHSWSYDSTNGFFNHSFNIYAEKTYYYITIDPSIGNKLRINAVDNTDQPENSIVNTYTHYDFYENDKYNFAESGKQWFDEGFDIETSKTYNFTIPEPTGANARITFSAGSTISQTSTFSITLNGNSIANMLLGYIGDNDFIALTNKSYLTPITASPLQINITYNKPQSSSVAYLDYIEFQIPSKLKFYKDQFPFCAPQAARSGNYTKFEMSNANSLTKVWDITNPYEPIQMIGNLNNGIFSFKTKTEELKYFIAFNGNTYYTVSPVGKINNQNLIGSSDVDRHRNREFY